jgi:integrase/recombinase XerD
VSLERSLTTTKSPATEFLQWLTIEKGRSSATIYAYQSDLDEFCRWMLARRRKPASANEQDFEDYVGHLRATDRAESSVARSISTLRGWFGFMLDEGDIDHDPTLRMKPARRGRTLPKPLSEGEMITLLDSLGTASALELRDRALLELLYGTGARVSEAVGINLEDLDFDEELILVTGKGSKQRLVPMGATLRTALDEYLDPSGRSQLVSAKRTSRLFLNSRGGPLSRQGVDLIVQKRALLAGVDTSKVSAHVFRHSCATHMLAHGADIRVVQELLGHASIATTQLYTAVSVTSLKREYLDAHPRAHE